MSELTTAARPYAKAVFEIAEATGSLDSWSDQLGLMASIVSAEGSASLLESPKASATQKVDMFVDVASGNLNEQSVNLLKSLGENNRFALLPDMASLFEELKSESQGEVEGELIAAAAVSQEQESAIVTALEKRLGRKVKLVTKIDESLLGGAVIRVGDLVIDGSLQGRFQTMKSNLS
ncbi:F0F1 ATP synthase subunit delta [Leucothrix pacifica]|uniref:ATP synthase subunit delta n=1 Tax=Leucothrix pacifica TaxID=1247513 RepID=A0A317CPH5_9GAMM|nr:F0F1 ATP synthase subunit delta [Leucothrix pacifica]PWR00128.1 F0F1 ATP synthase subunit delta [Leucothrix pacifica]